MTEQRQQMGRDCTEASGKGGVWQSGKKTESNHRGCLETGQREIGITDGKDVVEPGHLLLHLRTDSTNEPIAMGRHQAQDQDGAQLEMGLPAGHGQARRPLPSWAKIGFGVFRLAGSVSGGKTRRSQRVMIRFLVGSVQQRHQQPPSDWEFHRFIQQNLLTVIMSMNAMRSHENNLAGLTRNSRLFSREEGERGRL